jgi:hypothetical protein
MWCDSEGQFVGYQDGTTRPDRTRRRQRNNDHTLGKACERKGETERLGKQRREQ